MTNNFRKKGCVFGIIIGLAIIAIGFVVQNMPLLAYGGTNIEITIRFAVINICKAIGWIIVSIGAIDISVFVYKLCSFKDVSEIKKINTDTTAYYENK